MTAADADKPKRRNYKAKLEIYNANELTDELRYDLCNWLRKLSNDIGMGRQKYAKVFTAKYMLR